MDEVLHNGGAVIPEEIPDSGQPAVALVTPSVPQGKKRKKSKLRSAWIAFVGRIVAQLVGAIATVILGLYFLHRVNTPKESSRSIEAASVQPVDAGVQAPKPVRLAGETWLAVLPLQNFSAASGDGYLADGMTEALIAGLAQVDGLHVVSRTSSMRYKGEHKALPAIARELGVDLVVEGSVVRDNARVRVTAQLIDAASDVHLWARTYDRPLSDLLSLQSEVASEIAASIQASLAPGREVRRAGEALR
jgi:TolB-like protein